MHLIYAALYFLVVLAWALLPSRIFMHWAHPKALITWIDFVVPSYLITYYFYL